MRLRGKVKDCVDVVLAEASQDVSGLGEFSMEELEIRSTFEHTSIVQRAAVVQLVEADNVVRIGVLDDQMSNEPGSTGWSIRGLAKCQITHINPSPPVTSIFFTSGRGSNDV